KPGVPRLDVLQAIRTWKRETLLQELEVLGVSELDQEKNALLDYLDEDSASSFLQMLTLQGPPGSGKSLLVRSLKKIQKWLEVDPDIYSPSKSTMIYQLSSLPFYFDELVNLKVVLVRFDGSHRMVFFIDEFNRLDERFTKSALR